MELTWVLTPFPKGKLSKPTFLNPSTSLRSPSRSPSTSLRSPSTSLRSPLASRPWTNLASCPPTHHLCFGLQVAAPGVSQAGSLSLSLWVPDQGLAGGAGLWLFFFFGGGGGQGPVRCVRGNSSLVVCWARCPA